MERPFNVPIPLPRGPEYYWKRACKYGPNGFTIADMAGCVRGVSHHAVAAWVVRMVRDKHLKTIGARKSKAGKRAHVYAVAKASRLAPVIRRDDYTGQKGRVKLQMWRAMRTLSQFSIIELAAAASTDDCVVKTHTAQAYVRVLARVGVCIRIDNSDDDKVALASYWRLSPRHNSGPLAPKILRARIVFDPNREKIIGPVEVCDEGQ